jgi:FKBP-type peptidyl-prolyl cis-trans isomerase
MNFKRLFTLALVVLTGGAMLVSCNSDYPGYKKTDSGIYYKLFTKGNDDTTKVRLGKVVTMNLKYGLIDSTLFDSKEMASPIVLPVIESQYEGDFYEALQLFSQGDSASFVLKAGPFFTKTFGQPAVPEFMTDETDLYFDVKLAKVQSEEEIEAENQARNREQEEQELVKLQQYVQNNNITVQPSATGVYYMESKKGSGKAPVTDQYATVHFTVSLLDGMKLFSTVERGEPIDFKVGSKFENPGFQEAVGKMKEGGKATAIVPSSMAFGAQGAGNIVPPFSTLYYELELVKVMTEDEWNRKQEAAEAKKAADQARVSKEEDAAIAKFMKDNNLKATTTLPNGLIFIEKQAGTGARPVDGKKVKVHYTGKLLNGSVFDSSIDRGEPLEFVIGRGSVIEGWDTGIPLLSEGGKGMLIVPSRIGYGPQAMGEAIPANSTLIFDVELVETEK